MKKELSLSIYLSLSLSLVLSLSFSLSLSYLHFSSLPILGAGYTSNIVCNFMYDLL
jgi:hypothetical protein